MNLLNEGKYINGDQFVKDIESVFGKQNIENRDYKSDYYRYFTYNKIPFYIKTIYTPNPNKNSKILIRLNTLDNKSECASIEVEYDYDISYIKNLKMQLDDKMHEIQYILGISNIKKKQYLLYIKYKDDINYLDEEGYVQNDNDTLGSRFTARRFNSEAEAEDIYKQLSKQYEIIYKEIEEI